MVKVELERRVSFLNCFRDRVNRTLNVGHKFKKRVKKVVFSFWLENSMEKIIIDLSSVIISSSNNNNSS